MRPSTRTEDPRQIIKVLTDKPEQKKEAEGLMQEIKILTERPGQTTETGKTNFYKFNWRVSNPAQTPLSPGFSGLILYSGLLGQSVSRGIFPGFNGLVIYSGLAYCKAIVPQWTQIYIICNIYTLY